MTELFFKVICLTKAKPLIERRDIMADIKNHKLSGKQAVITKEIKISDIKVRVNSNFNNQKLEEILFSIVNAYLKENLTKSRL